MRRANLIFWLISIIATATGIWWLAAWKPAPAQPPPPPEGMVLVPAGQFVMGTDETEPWYIDARPRHTRSIEAFYIDIYEVTNEQYKKFCDATGHKPPPHWKNGTYPEGMAQHPVVNVSWHDAIAYCKWAGKRLPTEAEWEKAARGTDGRLYPWGNGFDASRCNGKGARGGTAPVGSFPGGVSPYGCHDMSGNVFEWVSDWYLPYPNAPAGIYDFFYGKKLKVCRGGSWDNYQTTLRATFRGTHYPWGKSPLIGFRCAKSVTK